ncbi:hypothetical protein ACUY4Q_004236 [Phytobacter sp. AG2a]|jgi:hypothetical protein
METKKPGCPGCVFPNGVGYRIDGVSLPGFVLRDDR